MLIACKFFILFYLYGGLYTQTYDCNSRTGVTEQTK